MVFLVCKLVSLSDDEREFVTSTFGIEWFCSSKQVNPAFIYFKTLYNI